MIELSDATLAYGEAICAGLLGVDALYRAEGDPDGLAVVNMCEQQRPEPFSDYAAAMLRFGEFARQARELPEADRRMYYEQLCGSTIAFCRWRRGELDFRGQLSDFLHMPAAPASNAELDGLRGEMHNLLSRMGFSGDLPTQSAAWEARMRVPPDEIVPTLNELLSEAWDRTMQRITIPADKSDGMRVRGVSGVPFNARCDYLERTIDLNIDPVYTLPALKHLAVHEGYPGHYLQFKLREVWYRSGHAPADGLLSLVNTASSSPFEGIADNGLYLLDWMSDDNDRLAELLTRYRAGIGTVAAWKLHAEGMPAAQVQDWLRSHALVGGEGWVDNRMRFLAAPQRSVLIWSYWWGAPAVTPVYQRVPAEQRPAFLAYLYGRMHSPQTVAMFA